MFVRAYLRASDRSQDANRARQDLKAFAEERGLKIAAWYVENESGTKLDRPELMRLIDDAHEDDICLLEAVDRLSRLNAKDWEVLKAKIAEKRIRIVALDLPTSWAMATSTDPDDFTARLFSAINAMLLDILASVARKDYDDRRRRQAQGIEKAKANGLYKGRPADEQRNRTILAMLDKGLSWSQIQTATGCSRTHIARLKKAG